MLFVSAVLTDSLTESSSGVMSGKEPIDGKTVCVTGGSGLVGAQVVIHLLDRGCTVRAPVRSIAKSGLEPIAAKADKDKKGRLELIEADVTVPGSLDSVVAGCSLVFHVASPVPQITEDGGIPDDQDFQQFIQPATKGVENVWAAIKKASGSVKKLIFTSSMVTIGDLAAQMAKARKDGETVDMPVMRLSLPKSKEGEGSRVLTGDDWMDEKQLEASPGPPAMKGYAISKIKAERECWKASEECGIPMATIHPACVIGPPPLVNKITSSLSFIKPLIEGVEFTGFLSFCDVRDVADAHIAAAELSSANGKRFIVSTDFDVPPPMLYAELQRAFPQYDYTCPYEFVDDDPSLSQPLKLFDTSPLSSIGIQLMPWEQSLKETAAAMIESKAVTPRPKGGWAETGGVLPAGQQAGTYWPFSPCSLWWCCTSPDRTVIP
ncbi:unnamed protein product [Vitrella brassicaformis CCMP3155]|uniref:NAD-dependent epimerase/dehydratase domain-containing protein n=1 Tax=Vitrella brassicaformis (strain CCMP3155) TaxID=1169540 RepID=A0A0G4EF38_VITBC|nr:unnamed protein product [Vitrella brassicaformis CCMP3155]|eukprot:CEL94129.1 unnamed protein product [Vitrella brassicaformis CCMP3155]